MGAVRSCDDRDRVRCVRRLAGDREADRERGARVPPGLEDDPPAVGLDEPAADRESEARIRRRPRHGRERTARTPARGIAAGSRCPWSADRTVTRPALAPPLIRTGARAGENLTAFSIRFENTRSSCAASARTSGRSPGSANSIGWSPEAWAGGRGDDVVQVAPVRLGRHRARLRSATGRADRRQLGQPRALALDHVDQLGALGVGDGADRERRARGRDRGQRRAQIVGDRVQDRGLGDLGACARPRSRRPARRPARVRRPRRCRRPSDSRHALDRALVPGHVVGRDVQPGVCRRLRGSRHRDLVAAPARAPARARRGPRPAVVACATASRCLAAGRRRCSPRIAEATSATQLGLPLAGGGDERAALGLGGALAGDRGKSPDDDAAISSTISSTRSCEWAIAKRWRGAMKK